MNTSTTKLATAIVMALHLAFVSRASTIVPFLNLSEMADASTAVVVATAGSTFDTPVNGDSLSYLHTSLTVSFVVKGNFQVSDQFNIEHYTVKGPGWVRAAPDDVNLTPGKSYLLFLTETNTGFWKPILLSYGVFEMFAPPGGSASFLVPMPEWSSLNILPTASGQPAEPLAVYRSLELLQHLRQCTNGEATWNGQLALETLDAEAFMGAVDFRTPPTHCTFLTSGGIGFRWQDMQTVNVSVRYPEDGDADCTPPSLSSVYAAAAAANMEGSYGGISIYDAGTYSPTFSPNCSDGTAVGSDYRSWIDATFNSFRNSVIQFNDPCNEITNLSNCSGTLAIGGVYGFTPTYTFDGMTYYQARYGFVIVNNGVCTCLNSTNYPLMLTHELTHSIGLGHIAASHGNANMNPTCCKIISSLDVQCVDYFYPLPLPVELLAFTATSGKNGVQLAWSTASEHDNSHFVVEKSRNGTDFEAIANLPGAGTSAEIRYYEALDEQPFTGLNYYRLRQMDTDGKANLSQIVTAYFGTKKALRMEALGNPVTGNTLQLLVEVANTVEGRLEVFDRTGFVAKSRKIDTVPGLNFTEIDVEGLQAGQYFVRLVAESEVAVMKFVKI